MKKFRIQFSYYHYDADFEENAIFLSKSNFNLNKQATFLDLNLFKDDKLINTRKCKCSILDNANDDTIYLSSILWFNFKRVLINNKLIILIIRINFM